MKAGWTLAALMFSSAAALADEAAVLAADGYARLKIGMTPEKMESVLGQKLGYSPYVNHGCSVVTTPQMERLGLNFVIDSKKLVRINVDYYSANSEPRKTKTSAGVGLSASEDEVLKAYGAEAIVKPNPADPQWHTIFVDTPDHASGIAFETDGKTVKSMRAGTYPALSTATGCP